MSFKEYLEESTNEICEAVDMTSSDLKYHLQMKLSDMNSKPDFIKNVKYLKRKNEFHLVASIGLTENLLTKCLDGTGLKVDSYESLKTMGVSKVKWIIKP